MSLKYTFLAFLTVVSLPLFSQTNTLPLNGDVGIGTTTPVTKFEVNGCATFDSAVIMNDSVKIKESVVVDQNITIKGNTLIEGELILPQLSNSYNYDKLTLTGPNGILKSGNIADVVYKTDCLPFTDASGNLSVYPAPSWASVPGVNNPIGLLYTGETCEVRVGIGTANPATRLDVFGEGHFTGNVGIGNYAPTDVRLLLDGSQKVGLCVNHSYGNDFGYGIKSITDNPLTKAIGVYNPGLNGDVFRVMGDGKVFCTELNVYHQIDFPDYVFAADYELMPLKTLKAYIAEYHHLPKVPTAAEVAENGMNVAELQVIQMEKIEELTLYLIQLNERVEKLEAENEALRAKLEDKNTPE